MQSGHRTSDWEVLQTPLYRVSSVRFFTQELPSLGNDQRLWSMLEYRYFPGGMTRRTFH